MNVGKYLVLVCRLVTGSNDRTAAVSPLPLLLSASGLDPVPGPATRPPSVRLSGDTEDKIFFKHAQIFLLL